MDFKGTFITFALLASHLSSPLPDLSSYNGTEPSQNVSISNDTIMSGKSEFFKHRLDILVVLDRSMEFPPRFSLRKMVGGEALQYNSMDHVMSLLTTAGEAFQDFPESTRVELKVVGVIKSTLESHQLVMKVDTERESYMMVRPSLAGKVSRLEHDVLIVFTKTSLCWTSHCEAYGLTTGGAACRHPENVAVIRVMGEYPAFVLTHELGHLLNMSHVGRDQMCQPLKGKRVMGNNGMATNESDSQNYINIMQGSSKSGYSSPEYKNPIHWTWTTCCESSLKLFLRSGHGSCLDKNSSQRSE